MLKGVPNRRYSQKFKKQVVETMLEEELSYSETKRRFELLSKRPAAWERIYLEDVPEGFTIECRGCSRTKRNGKLPKTVEENLLAEVQRLCAENEYLKTCKSWLWKTSDAHAKNAGSNETKVKTQIGNFSFRRSIGACHFLLSSMNEKARQICTGQRKDNNHLS